MAELVSKRYALSIFEAGLELEKLDIFNKELKYLDEVLKAEKDFFEILKNPRISKDEKKSLITEIFRGRLSQEVINFFYIIIDKRREKFIFDIIREYQSIYNEYNNILKVEAVTAIQMDEKAKEKLKLVLENKLGKKVDIINKVDKSILGGVLLKMEGKIIDSTIRSQLKKLENLITNVH
ncbi:MAG: ATP synthase F1 subunit delta [Tissierellia bacterium]|nr:ATP synthase F1 subunit delta [Tissierellia bacterium]